MLPRITRAVVGLAMTYVMAGSAPLRADERVAVAALDEGTFMKRVLEHSPRRAAFDARRRAADAQVGAAGMVPNPTLSFDREAVPGLESTDTFLRLGWTLDLSGRRGLARSAARAGADAERRDVDRDDFALEIEARLAYLDAAYAREVVSQLERARTQLADLVAVLRSRATQGDASSYDADRAALELDSLDDERLTAQRTLARTRLRLGALVGEPSTAYDASDPLALPTIAASVATGRRSEVDAALARAEQADREADYARRTWIPRLELVGGLKASTSSEGSGVGYVFGIAGDLPLFNRGGKAEAKARAEAERWRTEAGTLRIEAAGEVEVARRDLELRVEQARAYATGPLRRAADLQRRASVAYREGDRPILELLDVQRSAKHVAVRALELIYDARRAELALRRAQGARP